MEISADEGETSTSITERHKVRSA